MVCASNRGVRMTWSRRKVLGGLGVAAAASLLTRGGAAATLRPLNSARIGCQTYKILEIFLQGGLSHRETLWVEQPDQAPIWRNLTLNTQEWTNEVSPLVPPAGWTLSLPPPSNLVMGPGAFAIATHAIAGRMRLVATGHRLDPHEAASALTLTGLPLGRARGAGLGTVLQRKYGSVTDPVAFTIVPLGETLVNTYMAEAGLHGATNRPVQLRLGGSLLANLQRGSIPAAYKPHVNDLLAYYEDRYSGRLDYPGAGAARSLGHDSYATALQRLIDAPILQAKLAGAPPLSPVANNPIAGLTPGRQAIAIGCYLLQQGARYAGVIDQGILGGYDSHVEGSFARHALRANGNLYHLLAELARQVDDGVLDLDETLVVVRSEFGRTWNDTSVTGTNHWPHGYATLLIGGPITTTGVSGGMTFPDPAVDDCYAWGTSPSGEPVSPTDLRAALLLAAGVDPFDLDCLLPAETTMDGGSNIATRNNIIQHVLGLPPLNLSCPDDTVEVS
jgi:hypothetical protein